MKFVNRRSSVQFSEVCEGEREGVHFDLAKAALDVLDEAADGVSATIGD